MTRTDRSNDPDADGKFNKAPIVNFNDGKVKFNTNWFDNANDNYGSASALLAKSLLMTEECPAFCGAFSLPFSGGFYPTSEHSADFVDGCLESGVLFIVDGFYLFHKPEKDPKKIQLQARLLKYRQLLSLVGLARKENPLKNVQDQIFGALPNRVAILLGNGGVVGVGNLVEVVRFFEDRYIEFVHDFIFL